MCIDTWLGTQTLNRGFHVRSGDSTRQTAPLRPAEDAVLVDTSTLAFREQVDRIVALAGPILGRG